MGRPAATLAARGLSAVMVGFRDGLRTARDVLNRLNVYPVPDGDTGTNMLLTMEAVIASLDALDEPGMGDVCSAVSQASLMGARGNSGVILSQILRGLAGELAEAIETNADRLAGALRRASSEARLAVQRPVEGTILTVAAAAAEAADAVAGRGGDLAELALAARSAVIDAVARTPEQLPVLAEAGVVDAGGAGLTLLFDALAVELGGRSPVGLVLPPDVVARIAAGPLGGGPGGATGFDDGRGERGGAVAAFDALGAPRAASRITWDDSRGGGAVSAGTVSAGPWSAEPGSAGASLRYEVMFLLEAAPDAVDAFREVWSGVGDSIVVVGGPLLWKCHIHTDDVGAAIEAGIDAGRPRQLQVVDLAEQVEEQRWVREASDGNGGAGPPPRRRTTAVVAVASGVGIQRIFRSLGVWPVVAGGQSMNPSVAELVDAIAEAPAEAVVLLPNNGNVLPVAHQAASLATKEATVVPTEEMTEGIAALVGYDPEADLGDNVRAMGSAAAHVLSGQVTRAVRDSDGPAGPIARGSWLGLSRGTVEVVGADLVEVTCALLEKLLTVDRELVTLVVGEGAGVGETRGVAGWLNEHHPDVEIEVHQGAQPLYPFLIGIE